MDRRAAPTWSAAVFAGLLAGLLYGILLDGMGMMKMIGALIGISNVAVGWLVHLAVAVGFALVYAAVVAHSALGAWVHRPSTGWAIGALYGVVVWIVAGSFIMPAWLNAVGATSTTVPTFDGRLLAGHLVYGLTLGAAYPAFMGTEERRAVAV